MCIDYICRMKKIAISIKNYLRSLSFRTGIVILTICGLCYTIAFLQIFLPISAEAKGILGVVFLALAKIFQYAAIIICGPDGVRKIKRFFHRKQNNAQEDDSTTEEEEKDSFD